MEAALSGVYFRHLVREGKYGNICFEDLPEDQQREILKEKSKEWVEELALILAKSLKDFAVQFEISGKEFSEHEL